LALNQRWAIRRGGKRVEGKKKSRTLGGRDRIGRGGREGQGVRGESLIITAGQRYPIYTFRTNRGKKGPRCQGGKNWFE